MDKAGQTEGHIKITMPDGEEVVWTSVETTALETYDGPYNITENGVLATSDKKLTSNIVVDVPAPVPTLIEKNIAANGTYAAASDNADGYSEVNVNVPIPQPTLVTKSITQNGTYNASSDNADGYSSVTVNVVDNDDPIKEALDTLIPSWKSAFGRFDETGGSLKNYPKVNINMKHVKQSWFQNASNVTNMSYMFFGCSSLLDITLFDTSNVINMLNMFNSCSKLVSVPLFNTSKVTNMARLFDSCTSLESVPLFDTSNVTDMQYMFRMCQKITAIPLFDTNKVTNMEGMLSWCYQLIDVSLFDTSNVTNMRNMFQGSNKLTTIPLFDTRKVLDMQDMFSSCSVLKIIPALDVRNVTNLTSTFNNCSKLEEIHMYGMKVNFSISASTKFTREALVEILNNLATVDSTKTLKMGATNLAKLTEEDKAIATNKGWTLA